MKLQLTDVHKLSHCFTSFKCETKLWAKNLYLEYAVYFVYLPFFYFYSFGHFVLTTFVNIMGATLQGSLQACLDTSTCPNSQQFLIISITVTYSSSHPSLQLFQ